MKKIRVWADTHSTGLFNSKGEFYSKEETSISDSTWDELQKWVQDYDFIIPLDEIERANYKKDILELDERGKGLTEKIKIEWPFDVETGEPLYFVYYSEGLMKEQ